MAMFQEHDGLVFVRDGARTYCDTPENFTFDFGWALEALPEGVTERVYVPGVRHALNGPEGTVGGGSLTYSVGDAAIAFLGTALASQDFRHQLVLKAAQEARDAAEVAEAAAIKAKVDEVMQRLAATAPTA